MPNEEQKGTTYTLTFQWRAVSYSVNRCWHHLACPNPIDRFLWVQICQPRSISPLATTETLPLLRAHICPIQLHLLSLPLLSLEFLPEIAFLIKILCDRAVVEILFTSLFFSDTLTKARIGWVGGGIAVDAGTKEACGDDEGEESETYTEGRGEVFLVQ